MSPVKILQEVEKVAGLWPSNLPGHVNFDPKSLAVKGFLEDGAHRLQGSPWQFIVRDGFIVSAVREDLTAYRSSDETVYGLEPET